MRFRLAYLTVSAFVWVYLPMPGLSSALAAPPDSFKWVTTVTSGKTWISGCKKVDALTGKAAATELKNCLDHLPTSLVWKKKDSTWSVTGCLEVDTELRRPIRETSTDRCAEALPVTAAWKDQLEKTCAEYTQEGYYFIRDVASARCSQYHRVLDVASQQPIIVQGAWLMGSVRLLIPEIMSLAPDSEVPSVVYSKYSAESIATSLVQRLRKMIDGRQEGSPFFNFFGASEITVAFNGRDFDRIHGGCFKNQHQTGSSSGIYDPNRRAMMEDAFIQAKLEAQYNPDPASVANDVRPKYSYLSLQESRPELSIASYSKRYGNVVALARDEVKVRSTFTPGDSLDTHGAGLHTFFLLDAPAQRTGGQYWEAQVWGPLCEKDVEAWLVNCPGIPPTDDVTLEKLKSSGIPVHSCIQNEYGFWEKGDPIG